MRKILDLSIIPEGWFLSEFRDNRTKIINNGDISSHINYCATIQFENGGGREKTAYGSDPCMALQNAVDLINSSDKKATEKYLSKTQNSCDWIFINKLNDEEVKKITSENEFKYITFLTDENEKCFGYIFLRTQHMINTKTEKDTTINSILFYDVINQKTYNYMNIEKFKLIEW